jgi:hypothetical protein
MSSNPAHHVLRVIKSLAFDMEDETCFSITPLCVSPAYDGKQEQG